MIKYNDARLDDIVNSLNKKYAPKYKFESSFYSEIEGLDRIDISVYVYDKTDNEYYSLGWIAFSKDNYECDSIVASDTYNTSEDDRLMKKIDKEYREKIFNILND